MTKPWAERLEQDSFTTQDYEDASKWGTCAVGELEGIERSIQHAPSDLMLHMLGVRFSGHVRREEMPQARSTYGRIHQRAAELRNQEAAP